MSVVVAGCKVNLGLRITGVRGNGYHELDSLFWPLPRPCDRLHIRETGAAGLTVLCDTPGINLENNTLTKAYAALAKRVPDLPGLEVRLNKGIPAGAGLGGGSSDAAALLRWLNSRLSSPLDDQALAEVSQQSASFGAGKVIYLTNNLPYIYRLEFLGWSQQSPDGMARKNVARIQSIVRKAVAENKV